MMRIKIILLAIFIINDCALADNWDVAMNYTAPIKHKVAELSSLASTLYNQLIKERNFEVLLYSVLPRIHSSIEDRVLLVNTVRLKKTLDYYIAKKSLIQNPTKIRDKFFVINKLKMDIPAMTSTFVKIEKTMRPWLKRNFNDNIEVLVKPRRRVSFD